MGRNLFDRILSRDDDVAPDEGVTERPAPPRPARAKDRADEEPIPAVPPDPRREEDAEGRAVAPSIVRRRPTAPAVGKVYTCGKCRRKYTDLREYRIHLLRGHL
ncbi:MAG: hypothetical protein Q8S13_02700 [Dehalococcoidia bacterium]|nr:hypothetical protein [Dehalococcoidia bacterium]